MPDTIARAKQDAHQAQKQLSRQAREHVGVELEHDVGETPGNVGCVEEGAGMCVNPDDAIISRVDVDR